MLRMNEKSSDWVLGLDDQQMLTIVEYCSLPPTCTEQTRVVQERIQWDQRTRLGLLP